MPTIKDIVLNDISPNAPNYENNIRYGMSGYNVVFSFPTCPIEEDKNISFSAYVKNVKDTFTLKYDPKEVYGRMDPIPVYQRTIRGISFDLSIPSNGLAHSREISDRLNKLVRNTYPSYEQDGNVNVISSPPLVRIFFSSFIFNDSNSSGLLGYFTQPIVITHNLAEKGVFARNDGYEAYAKAYDLSFGINVLHEFTPGYINKKNTVSNELNILRGLR